MKRMDTEIYNKMIDLVENENITDEGVVWSLEHSISIINTQLEFLTRALHHCERYNLIKKE